MKHLFFAENIRHLRENILQISQDEILTCIGFKPSTWSGYERGASQPKLEDFVTIADYFGISEYDLLHTDLPKNSALSASINEFLVENRGLVPGKTPPKTPINTHENTQKGAKNLSKTSKTTPQNVHFVPQNVRPTVHPAFKNEQNELSQSIDFTPNYGVKTPAIITLNEHGIDNIIYVPVKARAGYLLGYGDPEFIETLPSFRMPGLSNSTYRMFEVEGQSMAPTLSNSDRVICEWVPSVDSVRDGRLYVVLTRDGVLIKRVINRLSERNKLYLKSDTIVHRAEYPLLEVDIEDIVEIWYVRLKLSSDLSEPAEIYQRVGDLEVQMHEVLKLLGTN